MANPHNIKVGQELWFVPTRYGSKKREHALTVTKVGRVWAEVTGGHVGWRFDLETLQIDGKDYTSPGTVYLNKEVWFAENGRQSLRTRIRHIAEGGIRNHITTEQLKAILEILESKP